MGPVTQSVADGAQCLRELTDLRGQTLRAPGSWLTLPRREPRSGAVAMQFFRMSILALAAACAAAPIAFEAQAQPAGLNVGRDCQVVRTCNFRRSGAYRGCLSSYTCRICRFVPARCYVDGSERVCQRMRCTWGG
jgi:hypothetical protein